MLFRSFKFDCKRVWQKGPSPWSQALKIIHRLGPVRQRRLDPGKETLEGFFQVGNQKEYQNVIIISFVHLEKINIFCFMHNSMAQKLSVPRPLENQNLNAHKSVNFKARDFSF